MFEPWGTLPMRKRAWTIEWTARPACDGVQRLGQGVALILMRARRAPKLVESSQPSDAIADMVSIVETEEGVEQ